jgi:hypothetical protein
MHHIYKQTTSTTTDMHTWYFAIYTYSDWGTVQSVNFTAKEKKIQFDVQK